MDIRTFDDLLLYMKRRRVLGYRPPVLLLGAGASFEAGIGTMTQLCRFTKVKDFDQTHPFAPVPFEVPEGLNAPGLRRDASLLMPHLGVRVGVAAGERVGISSGAIIEVDERRVPIAPVGEVDHLIAIDGVAAPGSAVPLFSTRLAWRYAATSSPAARTSHLRLCTQRIAGGCRRAETFKAERKTGTLLRAG